MNRPLQKAHAIANKFRVTGPAAAVPAGKLFAKKSDEKGELYIYQAIGIDWWSGGGVTGQSVKDALAELKGVTTLDIFINSEGGDVFEAKAIYTNLKRFDAEKVVHIDGIAASAASFIAMAGDRIITSSVATWMIHEAWTLAVGRAEDMRATADLLDMENRTIAETYAKQTGGAVDSMLELMSAETWMNAAQALEKGFTDEVADQEEEAADDSEDAQARAAKRIPAAAAAARTQERIKSYSPAQLLVARAQMHRRNSPGQPGNQRPASR